LLTASALAGCHTFHFQISDAPAASEPIVDHKSFYLAGLYPTRVIDGREVCPDGVAAIEEETSGLDTLESVFTLAIYTPRTSRYFCRLPAPAPAAEAAPPPPPGVTP
jgi:hypothetical protein